MVCWWNGEVWVVGVCHFVRLLSIDFSSHFRVPGVCGAGVTSIGEGDKGNGLGGQDGAGCIEDDQEGERVLAR